MSAGAGWYRDPSNSDLDIYWNGTRWSGSRLKSIAPADQPAAPSGTPLPAAPPGNSATPSVLKPRTTARESHGLGLGRGSIIDYGAGVIEYRATGKILPAFKVNIGDVTGFSVRKANKQDKRAGASSLQQVFVLQGGGTELASCPVNYGTAELIEGWIRKHPSFRGNVPQSAPTAPTRAAAPASIADELAKLGQLRDAGVLSPEQFEQAKAKLLG